MKTVQLDDKFIMHWLGRLRTAWINRDFPLVRELFKKCERYAETPFTTIGRNAEEVARFWEEIDGHSNVHLACEIVCKAGLRVVVNYRARYESNGRKVESDGIYVVDFD